MAMANAWKAFSRKGSWVRVPPPPQNYMKNLPLEYYPPLVQKAIIFLDSAKTTHEIKNRKIRSEEVTYYDLSQAVELSIKAVVQKQTREKAPRIHDKEKLAKQYRSICGFTDDEMDTIKKLKLLNNGPGGLRYDNKPIGQFVPSLFKKGVKIVERLIEKFE